MICHNIDDHPILSVIVSCFTVNLDEHFSGKSASNSNTHKASPNSERKMHNDSKHKESRLWNKYDPGIV